MVVGGVVGDWIVIESPRAGGHVRKAFVLEVLGEGDHEHYRVRWADDDHESIFFPGADAAVVHMEKLGGQ